MNWIKENRPFVLFTAALAGVLFGWHQFFYSPLRAQVESASREKVDRARELEALNARGAAGADQVEAAHKELEGLRVRLREVQEDLAFRLDDKFDPKDAKASAHFDRVLSDTIRALSAKFTGRVSAPKDARNLGFRQDNKLDDEVASEYLVRLAIATRIVEFLLKASEEGHGTVRSIDKVVPAPEMQQGSGLVVDRELYFNKIRVAVEFKASARATFRLIHRLQSKRNYLVIEEMEATKEDTNRDELTVKLTVAALIVHEDKEALTEDEKPKGEAE